MCRDENGMGWGGAVAAQWGTSRAEQAQRGNRCGAVSGASQPQSQSCVSLAPPRLPGPRVWHGQCVPRAGPGRPLADVAALPHGRRQVTRTLATLGGGRENDVYVNANTGQGAAVPITSPPPPLLTLPAPAPSPAPSADAVLEEGLAPSLPSSPIPTTRELPCCLRCGLCGGEGGAWGLSTVGAPGALMPWCRAARCCGDKQGSMQGSDNP